MTNHEKIIEMRNIAEKYNVLDRWGNVKFKQNGKTYRYKIKKRVVRIETKGNYKDWIMTYSVKIKNLSLETWEKNMKLIANFN